MSKQINNIQSKDPPHLDPILARFHQNVSAAQVAVQDRELGGVQEGQAVCYLDTLQSAGTLWMSDDMRTLWIIFL